MFEHSNKCVLNEKWKETRKSEAGEKKRSKQLSNDVMMDL